MNTETLNILILGSGGREHTLAWILSKSKRCGQLYLAPGNAGVRHIAKNAALDINNFEEITDFSLQYHIDMIVVGPEEPLVRGIKDFFNKNPKTKDIIIIGPNKMAAQLEGSKDFAKNFMRKYGIPSAKYKTFNRNQLSEALDYLQRQEAPFVIKADGLAAGKGVIIVDNHLQAIEELQSMCYENKFGKAGDKILIEEFLNGIELSVFILTDGKNYKILPNAKDYKRIGENDTGLNTGGMGAVSPAPFADADFMKKVEQKIIIPTLQGLNNEGIHYEGFLFFGLIKVGDRPYVIEYNVRLGDPETEAVLPRIESDFLELLLASTQGELKEHQLHISQNEAATVMLVSGGYPEAYEKDLSVEGLENLPESVIPFHAGTKTSSSGTVLTNGGRVISLTSLQKNYKEALKEIYNSIEFVKFKKMYYRRDIGQDLSN